MPNITTNHAITYTNQTWGQIKGILYWTIIPCLLIWVYTLYEAKHFQGNKLIRNLKSVLLWRLHQPLKSKVHLVFFLNNVAYNRDKPTVLFLSVQFGETGCNTPFLQYKRSRQNKKRLTQNKRYHMFKLERKDVKLREQLTSPMGKETPCGITALDFVHVLLSHLTSALTSSGRKHGSLLFWLTALDKSCAICWF